MWTSFIFLYGTNFIFVKICRNSILLPKLFWPAVRKEYPSDREKFLSNMVNKTCNIFSLLFFKEMPEIYFRFGRYFSVKTSNQKVICIWWFFLRFGPTNLHNFDEGQQWMTYLWMVFFSKDRWECHITAILRNSPTLV